jgi:hypothetical protein
LAFQEKGQFFGRNLVRIVENSDRNIDPNLLQVTAGNALLDEGRDDDEDEEGEHEVAEGQNALGPI